MRELFELADMVQLAVEDERTGVAFYSLLAKEIRRPELKTIFQDLADQEKHHQKRFEEILRQLGDRAPKEQYGGEYMAYLRTLAESRGFPDERTAIELAKKCMGSDCSNAPAVIDLATRFERDTLMLLNEMRDLVKDKDSAVVREIIREEQNHLVTLAEARKAMGTAWREM